MSTLFRRNVQNQKSDSDENNKGGSVHNKRESRNHIHHQQGLGHKRRRGISGSAKRNERGKRFRQEKRDGNGRKRWRDSRRLIFHSWCILRLYLDDWKDVLPQGISSFIDDIQAGNYSTSSLDDLSENFAVGKQLLRDYNIEAKHPVVMVPGVISTGN
ncbi:CPS_collapsed_G0049180.mRNA.1.CDS.1 [Saccharomyces cerevisiae]|nr:CPS_collapsed_G0049180.mRNA.1.CDS.1 [Saccharomyces cerevisiae]